MDAEEEKTEIRTVIKPNLMPMPTPFLILPLSQIQPVSDFVYKPGLVIGQVYYPTGFFS